MQEYMNFSAEDKFIFIDLYNAISTHYGLFHAKIWSIRKFSII